MAPNIPPVLDLSLPLSYSLHPYRSCLPFPNDAAALQRVGCAACSSMVFKDGGIQGYTIKNSRDGKSGLIHSPS